MQERTGARGVKGQRPVWGLTGATEPLPERHWGIPPPDTSQSHGP